MRLLIYLAYAVGLVLLAFLVIPVMNMLPTLWFIFYLLAGIFTLHNSTHRMFYFLINVAISVLTFIVTLKLLIVFIGVVASLGFLVSVFALSKKETSVEKKEKIKKIIEEVVTQRKEEEAKVEVYGEKKAIKRKEAKTTKKKKTRKKSKKK